MANNQSRHAALQRLAWRALKASRGESVTYVSGSYSLSITLVKTRPNSSQVDAADNVGVTSTSWDWLADPAELLTATDEPLEPKRGDKIVDATGKVYPLMPTNSGSGKVWRWSDNLETWRRIHTEEE
ncbi:MAG: hypothetical protein ACTHK7_21920 [Aureliella sp.]